jgi:2,4-dienoyl-CoA reductase-like NADH-dependent reductase (Old Yellow Enzyme family)
MAAALFSAFKIRDVTFRNRIFMAPMCQYSARDGIAAPWHLVHYGARAAGGSSLLIVEATAIAPEGRISPADLGLWNDEQAKALRPLTDFIHSQGAVAGIQLAHAGRKASTNSPWLGGGPLAAKDGGWKTVAPSPMAFAQGYPVPSEIPKDGLKRIVDEFTEAAGRAVLAGFKVIELHMAHGYLMHQFLSPLSNRRQDEFGGSLENRMRLPLMVAHAVREVWPSDKPLFVRLSATDWVEGGWDLDQCIEFVRRLKEVGVDFIDCSTGGLVADAKIPVAPGFQVPFAAALKERCQIPTGAVGLITEPEQAERILASGEADAILLGRELLRSPHWPLTAAQILKAEIEWPQQYQRAK